MHWIVSLQLLSGILYARRMLHQLALKNLASEKTLKAAAGGIFLAFFISSFVLFEHPLLQFGVLAVVCAGLRLADTLFQFRLKSRIRSEFPGFINHVLLAMKTGASFRAAIEGTLAQPIHIWEKWLLAMIESRVFLLPNAHEEGAADQNWWQELLSELQLLKQNPHHAIPRLENLRRKLKVLSDFRRKSGQALLQARIQMVVMTALYLALLCLTMKQIHIYQHRRLILLSVSLFVAGQLAFWWLARKRRWFV